jgi:hypothetical protein
MHLIKNNYFTNALIYNANITTSVVFVHSYFLIYHINFFQTVENANKIQLHEQGSWRTKGV